MINFSYTEEQQDIIRTVRALVEKEIAPYAAEMNEQS